MTKKPTYEELGLKDQLAPTPWRMYLLICLMGLMITGILGYGFFKGDRINKVYAPLVDAAMEIKLEATTAHLWFEEIISDDRYVDISVVWKHQDQAEWYAQAMLEGGKNPEGTFIPLDDAEMRRKIKNVLGKLKEFRGITQKRIETKGISGIGTDIDQRYDHVFLSFLKQVDEVETKLQQLMAKDLSRFRYTQVILIVTSILLFLAVGIFFWHFDNQRGKNLLLLNEANRTLRESEEQYRNLVETSQDMIWECDSDGRFTYVNSAWERVLGYKVDDMLGRPFTEFKPPEIVERASKVFKNSLKGSEIFGYETIYTAKSGEQKNLVFNIRTLKDANGNTIGTQGTAYDITERKQAELALKESEKRYRTLFETAADVILVRDMESGYFLDVNNVACERLGYSKKELLQMTPEDIVHPDYVSRIPGQIEDIRKRGPATFESAQVRRDGRTIPIEVSQQIIEYGERPALLSIIRDISDRKQAEEKIKASLKEKELLLSEIHHRVGNNMQVISSLLKIQSDKIQDKEYADMFKASNDRIRSMSLMHEKLYRSKDFANVDFNGYVKSLVNSLFRSYGIDTNKIKAKIEIEDVSLGIDTAIPCGLLINELVSNSLKYAFPEERNGEIRIALRSINDDELELIVSDDGIGIPEDLDIKNTESLGMELVMILAEDQLGGKVELNRTGGTKYIIRIKRQT